MFVGTVVCKHGILAKLLEIFMATSAVSAGINQAAHRSQIALFEFFHTAADRNHTTNDLMTWHAWICRTTPLTASGVNV